MTISLIVALAQNKAIGINNKLPWHLPNDLKFFKRTTLGKPVIMGRKTFDSLGKALPGRTNIVVSTNKNLQLPDGVILVHNFNDAINRLAHEGAEEIFIIGGAQLFTLALPLADRLYLTQVHAIIADADVFFPEIDHSHWKQVWEENHSADEQHQYAFTFQQLERISL
jgi:dihydrofolate reductase